MVPERPRRVLRVPVPRGRVERQRAARRRGQRVQRVRGARQDEVRHCAPVSAALSNTLRSQQVCALLPCTEYQASVTPVTGGGVAGAASFAAAATHTSIPGKPEQLSIYYAGNTLLIYVSHCTRTRTQASHCGEQCSNSDIIM